MQREEGAHERSQYVGNIAHVHDDRHEDIGEFVGIRACLEQFVVDFFKIADRLFFVREYFDHFAALHHLFDEAVDLS